MSRPPILLLAVFLAACWSDSGSGVVDPGDGDTRTPVLAKVAGDLQEAVVTRTLRRPLLVRVTDGAGNGMADVAVKFEVTGGDGRISTVEPSTNFSGFAATTWTLGTRAGSGHAVTASLPGENTSTVTFHATATAGPGTDLFLVSGDGQQGRPGGRLAEPVVFRVADRFDNPVPNQLVKFIADQGFGSMDPPDQRTDEAGRARASWTLGNVAGVQAASVWSPGLTGSPTRISARAAN